MNDIDRAAEVLRRGGLVAIPTETVYGLGADASNDAAVKKVFAAKRRPETHPLIVHIATRAQLGAWAASVPPLAARLAERFWPGPLTLLLPKAAGVSGVVTGGRGTVGLRVPDHPLTLGLLGKFGGGIAAPSANRFGSVSPTTAEDVRAELGADVDFVLDGGPCRVGVESTIVDLSGDEPVILRPGGVTREDLERAAGRAIPLHAAGGPAIAPGMHPSHYAPRAKVFLTTDAELVDVAQDLVWQNYKVAILATRDPGPLPEAAYLLRVPEDLDEFARGLYAALREADNRGCDAIVTALPVEEGMGLAIADRLRRAAGPRGE